MAELCTLCTQAVFDQQRWIIEISLSVPESCWCPHTHTHTERLTALLWRSAELQLRCTWQFRGQEGESCLIIRNLIIVLTQTRHRTTVRMFQSVWKLLLLPCGWGSCQCCSLWSMLLVSVRAVRPDTQCWDVSMLTLNQSPHLYCCITVSFIVYFL